MFPRLNETITADDVRKRAVQLKRELKKIIRKRETTGSQREYELLFNDVAHLKLQLSWCRKDYEKLTGQKLLMEEI